MRRTRIGSVPAVSPAWVNRSAWDKSTVEEKVWERSRKGGGKLQGVEAEEGGIVLERLDVDEAYRRPQVSSTANVRHGLIPPAGADRVSWT